MTPSIEQLGPKIVHPEAVLSLHAKGTRIVNHVWATGDHKPLHTGAEFTVRATDPTLTHLTSSDRPGAILTAPNDMDLFRDPSPLKSGESVKISGHRSNHRRFCPFRVGTVVSTFTTPGGAELGTAQCKGTGCRYAQAVGTEDRIYPPQSLNHSSITFLAIGAAT